MASCGRESSLQDQKSTKVHKLKLNFLRNTKAAGSAPTDISRTLWRYLALTKVPTGRSDRASQCGPLLNGANKIRIRHAYVPRRSESSNRV